MLAVGLGAAAVPSPRRSFSFPGEACDAGSRSPFLSPRRSPSSSSTRSPVCCGWRSYRPLVDACRRHSTICASWRPNCWRMPERSVWPARPLPDHEPEVRRRKGGQVRPEAQGRGSWGRGIHPRAGLNPWTSPASLRRRYAGGVDLLGVAGGDGTQAVVAAVAAQHDIPFVVVARRGLAITFARPRPRP